MSVALILGPVAIYVVTGRFLASLAVPAVLLLLFTEVEVQVLPRLARAHLIDVLGTISGVLQALIVVFAVEAVLVWPWALPLTLLWVVVSAAGTLPAWGVAIVTAAVSISNALSSWLARLDLIALRPLGGEEVGHLAVTEVFVLSLLVYPSVAAFLLLRSRYVSGMQHQLEGTIDELRHAQGELQRSQGQLRRWNEELSQEVQRQTGELEERNRSLSILNAISFALAEPMDDQRALERAARLVARLLGVRAAQAYHRAGQGDGGHLFVTVAAEDIHAPRLPEVLLRAVTTTGRPLASERIDWEPGVEVPDLGEPYAIVPLVAKGRVLGALALIGVGRLRWDDDGRHLLLLIGREMGVALENARLFGDAVERAAREEFLSEVSRLLNGEARGERSIPQALEFIAAHVGAREAMLLTLDESGRHVVSTEQVARGPGATESVLTPLTRSIPGLVSDRHNPLVLGSGGEAPLSTRLAAAGAGTLVLAPIITTRGGGISLEALRAEEAREKPHAMTTLGGVLAIRTQAGDGWSPEQTATLRRVSDLLARRLEADELVAVQRQRIHELTGLAEVARVVQSTADVDRLFSGFATAVHRLVPYRSLYLAHLDEFGDLQKMPVFGARGRLLYERGSIDADRDHPWLATRAPSRWRGGSTVPPSFFECGAADALILPMRPKGQMLGFVVLGLDRPARDDQMQVVEQAIEQLSLALDGTLLYQQATARASHIQALSNIARIVASVVDLREAFAAFAEEMRWLIPFDRAVMLLLDETGQVAQPYATYPEAAVGGQTPLSGSIVSVPVHAGAAMVLRRTDPAWAALDWSALGTHAAEVAAVPVRQGNRTVAVFALIHSAVEGAMPAVPNGYAAADLDALEEVAGLLGVTIERLRLYERAEHGANHDLLTGLPNYRYLQQRINDLRAGIDEEGESAVLVVDMDNLKLFNDSMGHEVGDRVIGIVARELRMAARPEDFVARTGGDEFVVLMEHASVAVAAAVAERVHARLLEAHHEVAGASIRLGVSIGIASAPSNTSVAAELIPLGDRAMYEAKFAGGHRTALARNDGPAVERGAHRMQSRRFTDSTVAAILNGATATEAAATELAQRWVTASVMHVGGSPSFLPHLQMLVALAASERLEMPRNDEDARIARYFLRALKQAWIESQRPGSRDVVDKTIPNLVGIAWRVSQAGAAPIDLDTALAEFHAQHPMAHRSGTWMAIEGVIRGLKVERAMTEAA